ncbi:MAG: hypothetical protein KGO96_13955, partial [Elusimicrobia bacterium]|nr:hypothetical protein [Elusimicrobiota bacterium]
ERVEAILKKHHTSSPRHGTPESIALQLVVYGTGKQANTVQYVVQTRVISARGAANREFLLREYAALLAEQKTRYNVTNRRMALVVWERWA